MRKTTREQRNGYRPKGRTPRDGPSKAVRNDAVRPRFGKGPDGIFAEKARPQGEVESNREARKGKAEALARPERPALREGRRPRKRRGL